jgi:uncharacterized protein YegP (UPF0339 family)
VKNHTQWTIYRGKDGDYRWKAQAANWKTILASSEGYRRRQAAARNAVKAGGPVALLKRDAVLQRVKR